MVERDSNAKLERIRTLLGVVKKEYAFHFIYGGSLAELVELVSELDEDLTSTKDQIPDDWDSRYKLPPD